MIRASTLERIQPQPIREGHWQRYLICLVGFKPGWIVYQATILAHIDKSCRFTAVLQSLAQIASPPGEYAAMIAASAMMVTLFFGGWTLPGLSTPASTIAAGLLHIGIFVAKLLAFMVLFIWVRWMLPRFRYDQLMDLGWRRFIPLALVNILITAVVLWLKAN